MKRRIEVLQWYTDWFVWRGNNLLGAFDTEREARDFVEREEAKDAR